MAIAVIGGLLVSTVLSLVFVPSFYIVMDDIGRQFSRAFARFVGPKEDESLWAPLNRAGEAVHADPAHAAHSEMPDKPRPRLAAE